MKITVTLQKTKFFDPDTSRSRPGYTIKGIAGAVTVFGTNATEYRVDDILEESEAQKLGNRDVLVKVISGGHAE